MHSNLSTFNLSGSEVTTMSATNTTPITAIIHAPTSEKLIDFSLFLEEIHGIVLNLLPMTAVCNLLATCSVLQLRYRLLLSEAGNKYFGTNYKYFELEMKPGQTVQKYKGEMAKKVFNYTLSYRLPHFFLAGPRGEEAYTRHHKIVADRSVIQRLRTGILSVSELNGRQKQWHVLKNRLIKHRARKALVKELPEIIHWLERQITLVGSELRPTLARYILDGSLPLTLAGIGIDTRLGRVISSADFKLFQDILNIPSIAFALANQRVSISELFAKVFCCDDEHGLVEICKSPRIKAALNSGEVQLDQLRALCGRSKFPRATIKVFCKSLDNLVISACLDRNVLTIMQLMELAAVDGRVAAYGCWYSYFEILLDIFDIKAVQRYFVSNRALFKQLMSLHEKNDVRSEDLPFYLYVTFSSLKKVLGHPIIQQHLNDVKKGKLCLQQILNLACEQGGWRQNPIADLKRFYSGRCEGIDQLFYCPGLLKLYRALSTEVIQSCIQTEGDANKLCLSQLIDLIVEEGQDPSYQLVPWYLATHMGYAECSLNDENYPPGLRTFYLNEYRDGIDFMPFEYAKVALALMHPEVKQRVDEGTLSVQELSEKLKSDPLSGYRVALFGLSAQHSVEYKQKIQNNFQNAFYQIIFWHLMETGKLTMDQFMTMIREDRHIVINDSSKPLWEIIFGLQPLIGRGYVSVNELMYASYEVLVQLYQPRFVSIDPDSEIGVSTDIGDNVSKADVRAIVDGISFFPLQGEG